MPPNTHFDDKVCISGSSVTVKGTLDDPEDGVRRAIVFAFVTQSPLEQPAATNGIGTANKPPEANAGTANEPPDANADTGAADEQPNAKTDTTAAEEQPTAKTDTTAADKPPTANAPTVAGEALLYSVKKSESDVPKWWLVDPLPKSSIEPTDELEKEGEHQHTYHFDYKQSEKWYFKTDMKDENRLRVGPAFGTAILVTFMVDGSIETYSWSGWVKVVDDCASPATPA